MDINLNLDKLKFSKKQIITFFILLTILILFYLILPFVIYESAQKLYDKEKINIDNYAKYVTISYKLTPFTKAKAKFAKKISPLLREYIFNEIHNISKYSLSFLLNTYTDMEKSICSVDKNQCDNIQEIYLVTKRYDDLKNLVEKQDLNKNWLVKAYMLQGDYKTALEIIDTHDVWQLVDLYIELKEYDKALDLVNSEFKKYKNNYHCYIYRGKIYNRMNNKKAELQEYNKYVKYSDDAKTHTIKYIDFVKRYDPFMLHMKQHQKDIEKQLNKPIQPIQPIQRIQ